MAKIHISLTTILDYNLISMDLFNLKGNNLSCKEKHLQQYY